MDLGHEIEDRAIISKFNERMHLNPAEYPEYTVLSDGTINHEAEAAQAYKYIKQLVNEGKYTEVQLDKEGKYTEVETHEKGMTFD